MSSRRRLSNQTQIQGVLALQTKRVVVMAAETIHATADEALRLVRAFVRIADAETRSRLIEIVEQAMAASTPEATDDER